MLHKVTFCALSAFLALSLCSCTSHRIKLWDGFDCVVSKDSTIVGYNITGNKPFVVQYFSLKFMEFILEDTPCGKIDQIIRDNPEWEFIFYCNCSESEVPELQTILSRYNCGFPMIIDIEGEFARINGLGNQKMAIGFICDEKGMHIGTSVIGASMSLFDSQFKAAKAHMGME